MPIRQQGDNGWEGTIAPCYYNIVLTPQNL